MTTTAAILLSMARKLKRMRFGLATGGSATTLVDSAMDEPDDFFNGGVIFFLSGSLNGKTANVTSWDLPTKTFTFATQTAAVVAGVRYAVVEPAYNREMLVSALNEALAEFGPVAQYDTSLLTVLDQQEYMLPPGVSNVKSVQIAGDVDATSWGPVYRYWKEVDGTLHFDSQHLPSAADLPIRMLIVSTHSLVWADTDSVTDSVNPELLAWKAVECAARNRSGIAENTEPYTKELMQVARAEVERLRREFPVRRPMADARYNSLLRQEIY